MTPADESTLHEAIARNMGAVVSLPSAGMLRHHKTRFLAEDAGAIWIQSAPEEGALVDELIAKKTPVGMSFKSQVLKVIFTAPILERKPDYRVNAELSVEALRLAFPTEIKSVQRRNNYRVHIREATEISVRVWRIAPHAVLRDRPAASAELQVALRDLSIGGMGLILLKRGPEPPRIIADERLRVVLRYQEQEEVLLEGLTRHIKALPNGNIQAGVQFKKLESDIDGRQALARLRFSRGEGNGRERRRFQAGEFAALPEVRRQT